MDDLDLDDEPVPGWRAAPASRYKLLAVALLVVVSTLGVWGDALFGSNVLWVGVFLIFLSGVFCIRAGLSDRDRVIGAQADAHPMLSYRDKEGRTDLEWLAGGIFLVGSALMLPWGPRYLLPF